MEGSGEQTNADGRLKRGRGGEFLADVEFGRWRRRPEGGDLERVRTGRIGQDLVCEVRIICHLDADRLKKPSRYGRYEVPGVGSEGGGNKKEDEEAGQDRAREADLAGTLGGLPCVGDAMCGRRHAPGALAVAHLAHRVIGDI